MSFVWLSPIVKVTSLQSNNVEMEWGRGALFTTFFYQDQTIVDFHSCGLQRRNQDREGQLQCHLRSRGEGGEAHGSCHQEV